MAMHPRRIVKKTPRLDPDKLAQLQKLLQTTSESEAVRQAIDETLVLRTANCPASLAGCVEPLRGWYLAYSEALQAARRIQQRGTFARD